MRNPGYALGRGSHRARPRFQGHALTTGEPLSLWAPFVERLVAHNLVVNAGRT